MKRYSYCLAAMMFRESFVHGELLHSIEKIPYDSYVKVVNVSHWRVMNKAKRIELGLHAVGNILALMRTIDSPEWLVCVGTYDTLYGVYNVEWDVEGQRLTQFDLMPESIMEGLR